MRTQARVFLEGHHNSRGDAFVRAAVFSPTKSSSRPGIDVALPRPSFGIGGECAGRRSYFCCR